ncbi:MAG: HAMP domain-containing protein [Nitrospinales bacterium]
MKKNRIFREELPGEKKSIISLLLTGYIAVISILGYTAFYMNIQLGQIERVLPTLEHSVLDPEQFTFLKTSFQKSLIKLQNEIIWIAVFGSLFSIIGGFYTYSMIVKPLRQLVSHIEEGKGEPPELKSNNEIKQLMSAIDSVNGNTNLTQPNPETKTTA